MQRPFPAFLFAVIAGCQAPAVLVDPPDALGDGTTDVSDVVDVADAADGKVCRKFFKKDGTPCGDHDEDGDCVPDDCDDCPGLANQEQVVGALPIGNACQHHEAPFDEATLRYEFDDFTSIPSSWQGIWSFPTDAFVSDGDELVGGVPLDNKTPFLRSTEVVITRTVVATTVLTMVDDFGTAAVLLQTDPAPSHLFACVLQGSTFFPAYVVDSPRCTAAGCAFKTFSDGSKPIVATVPAALKLAPGTRIGLRASISSGLGGAERDLECRVFDPATPTTLQIASGNGYSLRAKAPPVAWLGSAVGVLANYTSVRFENVDVLISPAP